MSKSQEQSLAEDAVFLPVNESSPGFLYCEKERQAVERLLSAGPEAFYTAFGTERCSCFLSPEEVTDITSWAQDYRFNQLQVQQEENGAEGSSEMEDFCSTYFPCHSDTPAPSLELGWPEKSPLVPNGSVAVHTSPPAEGEPPVREIIRWHLQMASKVIAVVTDRLTDGPIIEDLHNAASRGVPVYIILDQRSSQKNFTLNRLRHPNMRVRVLGGKTFRSRTGRIVVGEMKEKFILVDLKTVIHGSYSLTWTDAHLHRQLITVLRGPAVESFDREFRILFAASLPVPDRWRVAGTHVEMTDQLKDFSDLRFKRLSLEPDITNPPSPPADSFLDWEAMGVVQLFPDNTKDITQQNNLLCDTNTPIMDGFTNDGNQFLHMKRVYGNTSPVTNHVLDKSTFNNTLPSTTDPINSERINRMDRKLEKAISRQLSIEKATNLNVRTTTRPHDEASEPTHNMATLCERYRRGSILEEESGMEEPSSKVETTASRKPVILRMPQSESFSSLSDIMRRIQPQQSSSGLFRRASKNAVSEMSQSMMDLSLLNTDINHDEKGVPELKFKATGFDSAPMTPAHALMQNRNSDMKSVMYRTPKSFLPRERPRSYTFAVNMNWKKSLTEGKEKQEMRNKDDNT